MLVPTVAIPDEGINFTSVVSQLERELILRCLEKTGGNKRQAARLLNLSRTTFIDKLQRLNAGAGSGVSSRRRQAQLETRAGVLFLQRQRAPMLFDNDPRDGESESTGFITRSRREERLEQLGAHGLIDARSVVETRRTTEPGASSSSTRIAPPFWPASACSALTIRLSTASCSSAALPLTTNRPVVGASSAIVRRARPTANERSATDRLAISRRFVRPAASTFCRAKSMTS